MAEDDADIDQHIARVIDSRTARFTDKYDSPAGCRWMTGHHVRLRATRQRPSAARVPARQDHARSLDRGPGSHAGS